MGFENELRALLLAAQEQGKKTIIVNSGDLHRRIGGYPAANGNHRMPVCCSAMKRVMQPGDRMITSPPKGNGATLTIEYTLPRKE